MLKQWGLLLLMASTLGWMACGSEEPEIPKDEQGVEDFEVFYQRFLNDSAFQMARITFPLKSEVPLGEEATSDKGYYIKKKDWVLNKPFDAEAQPDVKVSFEDWNGLIIERFVIGSFFYVERHYGLNHKQEWELIYYSGMQEGSKKLDELVEPEVRKQKEGEVELKME